MRSFRWMYASIVIRGFRRPRIASASWGWCLHATLVPRQPGSAGCPIGGHAVRVLFTTLPQLGHFHPLVPVARAVRDGGHDVAFACPASFAAHVEAAGFRVFPAGFDDRGAPFPTVFPGVSRYPVDERGPWVIANAFIGLYSAVMATDLLRVCRDWRPDLLVRDTSEFGGCVAAEASGLPHATVRTGAWTATYALRHRWTAALAPLRERAGLDPDPDATMPFRYLHLAAEPPGFARPGDVPAPTAHLLRPESSEAGDEPPPPWVAGLPDRPTVYATLGTVFGGYPAGRATFSAILAALRDEPCNLIVTVGRDIDPTDFGSQPPHVRIERYIPQGQLLPHCDVVVNQGGFSTITGALGAGLPLVVIPIGADQPLNAACCESLGVGQVIGPDERTPELIRDTVRAVLADPAYRANSARVREEMAPLPGLDHAVNLLERLARDRTPILAST
jgi:UDP:flavonoid glycosyltransferase YjiC (YdhE family)